MHTQAGLTADVASCFRGAIRLPLFTSERKEYCSRILQDYNLNLIILRI